jgi:tetratricopeptide (TPR) repeat protein
MSTDLVPDAVLDGVIRRATSLMAEGFALYESNHNTSAAIAYERAAQAAETIGRDDIEASARFWQGVCLHSSGRLREALAALAPIAAGRLQPLNSDRPVHMGITRYVLIAVDLPLGLEVIERAIRDAERLERHTGKQRRSRLLLARARLAASRGEFATAIRDALEGLQHAPRDGDAYARSAYLKEATRACLRLGRIDEARRLIDDWSEVRDPFIASRRVMIATHRSIADRLEGNIGGAVEHAREATRAAAGSEDCHDRIYSHDALVRALLCSPAIHEHRKPLARLLAHRHADVGLHRYALRLLAGDALHAMTRHAAGLPAVDPESGMTFPAISGGLDERRTRALARRARTAYAAASRIGVRVDRLLASTTWTRETNARIALLGTTGYLPA